jgi:hypothetical protein
LQKKIEIGKSSQSIAYHVLAKASRFWGIFWIHANSETEIESDFIEAGKEACAQKEIGFKDAKRWFENTEHSWLIIMDNADNPKLDLYKYFLQEPEGAF